MEGVTKNGSNYITNVQVENGYIVGYQIDGKDYVPVYDENGNRMDNNYFGTLYTFSTEPNALYVAELPAVLPFYVFGTDLSLWLYNKYLPESLGDIDYTVNPMTDNVQSLSWLCDGNEAMIEYTFNLE